jgi:uncharacterized RDD family membrane protein YckC
MYCMNCGKQINEKSIFCKYCGRKIQSNKEEFGKQYNASQEIISANSDKRLLNYFIDLIMAWVFTFVLIVLLVFFGLYSSAEESGSGIWYYVGIFLYFFGTEVMWGKTAGKLITKTKVVNKEGKKPSWQTIFARTLCRLIPFDGFSFLGKNPRGWHDSISHTYVVDDK